MASGKAQVLVPQISTVQLLYKMLYPATKHIHVLQTIDFPKVPKLLRCSATIRILRNSWKRCELFFICSGWGHCHGSVCGYSLGYS